MFALDRQVRQHDEFFGKMYLNIANVPRFEQPLCNCMITVVYPIHWLLTLVICPVPLAYCCQCSE